MKSSKLVLVVEPCPELVCGICQDIFNEPMQVRCPEDHIFCKDCITDFTREKATCPTCDTPIDTSQFQPSKFVTRQIGRLRVRCPYQRDGCDWEGHFGDSHVSNCSFQTRPCPNAEHGCKKRLKAKDVSKHRKECLYELIHCPNGRPECAPFLRSELATHGEQCRFHPCTYASGGCPFVGTQQEVDTHCDKYCGKMHAKILLLEAEVTRLKGLLAAQGTAPEHIPMPDTLQVSNTNDNMDFIQQLLSGNNPLLDMKGLEPNYLNQDFMDLGLSDFSFDPALAGLPLVSSGATSVSSQAAGGVAPKRASNGKRIRYSKNTRVAHNALRLARQEKNKQPDSIETILNELDMQRAPLDIPMDTSLPTTKAGDPATVDLSHLFAQQSISSPPRVDFSFSNIDDVAKFLAEMPTPTPQTSETDVPSDPPSSSVTSPRGVVTVDSLPPVPSRFHPPSPIAQRDHDDASVSTSAGNDKTGPAPKKRDMFVLASSYLTNFKQPPVHNHHATPSS